MVSIARSPTPSLPGPNAWVIAIASVLLVGGAALNGADYGWRHAALYVTGGALGIVLYHAAFGFTAAWRRLFVDRDGSGLRAQIVMLAIASLVFLPVVASGTFLGRLASGAVADAGLTVVIGAFLFGIGMQIGGGCASGTLFAVGGGSTRTLVTLVFFVLGSVIATAHAPWWYALPGLGAISLTSEFGLAGAFAVQFVLLAAIYLFARRLGGTSPATTAALPARPLLVRIARGPWPLLWGAVGLALLNILTLALAGHPWSITFAFSLWGAKLFAASGIDVAAWEFWTWPYPARALQGGVLEDVTSTMNIALIFGATLAAGLAGRFAPVLRVPLRSLAAAVIGGLLLGYGARLAYGCNIGAFFNGVISGSLHGWVWLIAALAGNWLGVRFRPFFGLAR